jgi:hypothetical protein
MSMQTKHDAGPGSTLDPLDMREIAYAMSNFDYEVDDGMAEALMNEPGQVFGRHAGWNFNGRVYFHDGMFHEQVWVYGSPLETISADTLEDLMKKVNQEYGAD